MRFKRYYLLPSAFVLFEIKDVIYSIYRLIRHARIVNMQQQQKSHTFQSCTLHIYSHTKTFNKSHSIT